MYTWSASQKASKVPDLQLCKQKVLLCLFPTGTTEDHPNAVVASPDRTASTPIRYLAMHVILLGLHISQSQAEWQPCLGLPVWLRKVEFAASSQWTFDLQANRSWTSRREGICGSSSPCLDTACRDGRRNMSSRHKIGGLANASPLSSFPILAITVTAEDCLTTNDDHVRDVILLWLSYHPDPIRSRWPPSPG